MAFASDYQAQIIDRLMHVVPSSQNPHLGYSDLPLFQKKWSKSIEMTFPAVPPIH